MLHLQLFFERMRLRFWATPSLVIAALIGLFFIVSRAPEVDSALLDSIFPKHYSGAGARLILSSSATALMTVVGVLFSITVVVLQQVSSQYSPRIIENFIKSHTSQMVLGTFVGTFAYCMLMLGQIRGETIPQLGMILAIVLVMVCLALLIHFIHHIVHSIQSTSIIANIRQETVDHLESFIEFIDEKRLEDPEELKRLEPLTYNVPMKNKKFGYLQGFDKSAVKKLSDGKLLIRLTRHIGDHLDRQETFAEIVSDGEISKETYESLQSAFDFGEYRTHSYDFRYGIRQLVDVALRALSPSVNDPSTAREALYAISSIMTLYTRRYRHCEYLKLTDRVTIAMKPQPYAEALNLAYGEIICAGKKHALVILLIETSLEDLLEVEELSYNAAREIRRYLREIEKIYNDCPGRVFDLKFSDPQEIRPAL